MVRSAGKERAGQDLGALGDPERIRVYSRLIVAAYVVAFATMYALSPGLVDPMNTPFGYDFISFWTAGGLTLDGHAAAAFDRAAIVAAQRVVAPGSDAVVLWHYPPTFQLIAAGLALMPYLVSFFVFVAAGVAVYVAVLGRIVPWREPMILLLAFPGAFSAAIHGQNSLFSAALICGALLLLDRRPLLAGVCIGLLAYKPQLAVMFPLVLAATGRWRTFAAAAATAAAFAGVATLALGPELWGVFFANSRVVAEVLASGELPWAKMPSAYVFLAMLGAPSAAAYAGQALVAVAAMAVTLLVWRRCGASRLAGGTLVAGTLMTLPYLFDYELAMLAIPLSFLAADLIERGARLMDKLLLVTLFALPIAIAGIAATTSVQIGFPILVATFVWSARRALAGAVARPAGVAMPACATS